MSVRVLSIEEATPLLLDINISPVVSLDTEFNKDTGALHGMSMAGGPPHDIFGCFWSFQAPYEQKPFREVLEQVIKPLFGDPARTVVMHPISIDISKLRQRGLTDAHIKCTLEDTIAMAYIYDDNLPHSLKDLMYCILLDASATSYSKTQREIADIKSEGGKVTKQIIEQVWLTYKEYRSKSMVLEETIDPSWPSWKQIAMDLPPGMVRSTPAKWKCAGKNGCGYVNLCDTEGLGIAALSKRDICNNCSRERKITLGVEQHVLPIIEPVVQKDFDQRAHNRFALYGAKDAIATLGVRYQLKPRLTQAQCTHLQLETDITYPVVTKMEERGLKIDVALLGDICTAMRAATDALNIEVTRIWRANDTEFNPDSADQVAKRLWLDWGVRPPRFAIDREGAIKQKHRRNKDGLCSTDASVLEALARQHTGKPIGKAVQKLHDLRRWTKLLGTYVEPILGKALRDPDHRIHASFWPTGARSGRFSSSDPNVENIPRAFTMPIMKPPRGQDPNNPPPGMVKVIDKKSGLTKAWRVQSLREVFIPPSGYSYASADLSQIENRIIAYESRDPNMLKLYRKWDCFECKSAGDSNVILHACPECGAAEGKRDKNTPEQPVISGFSHGGDIHSLTAAMLGFFEKYGDDARQQAKPVNHAATYGMGPGTFSTRQNIPYKDAERDLEAWHSSYPSVGHLHKRVACEALENGFIKIFDGHVRSFHAQRALKCSGNFKQWQWDGTVREGVNVLAQGGTGVIMKRAMLAIYHHFQELGKTDPRYLQVHLVNQVHDELLYEAPEGIIRDVFKIVCYYLEHSALELDIPILAEGGIGSTWGQAH